MGNTPTKTKKSPKKLGSLLDQIATKYIITQNFQDLANLENKKYCDKLVVLTSKIFNKFLDRRDVNYLEQRMERGVLVDKMDSDTLIYLEKANLGKLDVKNSIRKKRMCIGIARFYIKIGHVFAAILKTLNPEYTFKDYSGQRYKVSLLDKKKIPGKYVNNGDGRANVSLLRNTSNNICSRRLKALTPKINRKGKFNIRVCKINTPVNNEYLSAATSRKFTTEPGVPELRALYLDYYDYGTGKFTKMTAKSKQQYKNDVALFYKVFTGRSRVPSNNYGILTNTTFRLP